jgi:hypothetical protein
VSARTPPIGSIGTITRMDVELVPRGQESRDPGLPPGSDPLEFYVVRCVCWCADRIVYAIEEAFPHSIYPTEVGMAHVVGLAAHHVEEMRAARDAPATSDDPVA